jgi:YD repeat-containing protein
MMFLLMRNRLAQFTALAVVCTGAQAQSPSGVTTFEYDALGNLIVERNGLQHAAKHNYDALSRLKSTFDPNDKRSQFEYDLGDQLTKVIDARNVSTGYVVDGLGKLTQTTSGDTGTTITEYDEAGNLIASTDAKKQTTRFEYDALNRIKLVTYADTTTVQYFYDQSLSATGRLSKIVDAGGSITYEYDTFGDVVSEVRIIGGASYKTGYRYDQYGRLAGLDYPSGRKIDYELDSLGRVAKITTLKAGASKPIVAEVSYEPFGGVNKITFGNGKAQTRTYDLDGRLESYTLRSKTIALGYDSGNRLRTVADATAPSGGTRFDYDKVDRLTGVISPTTSQVYGYDDVGNRISRQINGAAKALSYAPTSNRLTAIGSQPIVTDDNGSITSRGDGAFKYDSRGRLISFQGTAGLIKYTINSLGQRVSKVTPTATTIFHYDSGGKLIAEATTESGTTKTQEYVYLGDIPVAVLK